MRAARSRFMRDGDGGLMVRQRATLRPHPQGPRPSLRCALVVETLPLFAEGVVRLLRELADIGRILTAPNAANFRSLLTRHRPDLVVLDLDALDMRPLEVARLVQRQARRARLILLSATFSPHTAPALLRAGASAVLLKSAHPADMREAFARVLRERDSETPARAGSAVLDWYSLSQREREVLTYVALGFSVKRTADALGLRPKTIETHRTRLMAKLHIHDRVLLTHYALNLGIVPQVKLPTRRNRSLPRPAAPLAAP